MASQWKRLLDGATVTANWKQPKEDAFDAGAYRVLELQCRVVKPGTAGSILLEHAAVNDEAAFVALTGISWLADGSTGSFKAVNDFLRYVRVAGDNAVAGSPAVILDLIAKE